MKLMFSSEASILVLRGVYEKVQKPCHINQQVKYPQICFGDVLAANVLDHSFLSRE